MNWEAAATCVGLGLTIAGAGNYFLIRALLEGQKEIKAELRTKTTLESCLRMRSDCMRLRDVKEGDVCTDTKELWDAFNKHSHTGLPDGSKVTR